ncbi:MAG: insulinase family protein [Bacteroidota bacterium]|nr:insulinase family protein [Bacteroidota bacterium]
MKRIAVFIFLTITVFAQKYQTQTLKDEAGYTYTTVTDDPLKTRIYKLQNGLTVYLSVYKNTPRIQTFIAVRAGSKNDPSSLTGLAHYLEHMVFKGTSKIGAQNFDKEKVQLDKIENLYENYRQTKDTAKRRIIYQTIDSVSGVAAKLSIANEYDKMLNAIGAKGTNAYTWVEQTVYVNDIPSNELERWAKIEAERFGELTPRLFHTELEAVYEEKNRSLDNDMSKVIESTFNLLFPNHQYGSQTTIGTVEHLKNPSIKAIKEYFYKYYVPNNMAICLSGDLDPAQTIQTIDKYWGGKKAKDVPLYVPFAEKPIEKVLTKTIVGPSPQSLVLCYRFPGAASKDAMIMEMFGRVLSNGKAGLMDLNLTQKQKVLNVSGFPYRMKDYSIHIIFAMPREGQSLDQVKELILAQIDSVKAGKFDENLIKAIINNEKISLMKSLEDNGSRADYFVDAYIKGIDWAQYMATIDDLSKITKKDIVEFANKYYGNNYAAVYKLTGKDTTIQKVPKPKITPVDVNRDAQSDFIKLVLNGNPKPIEPVFMDFNKEMNIYKLNNGNEVWYKQNTENQLFELSFKYRFGKTTQPRLALALAYINYLGTSKRTAEQIKQELYQLGCEFNTSVQEDQLQISLNGLSENMEAALMIIENLLADAKPDEKALKDLVDGILKERTDAKLDKGTILRAALVNYAKYGKVSPFTNIIKTEELKNIQSKELLTLVSGLSNYNHEIWYYGPITTNQLTEIINKVHGQVANPLPVPTNKVYKEEAFANNEVYFVNYDMVQAEMIFLSKSVKFDKNILANVKMYNEYFGGSMNSIVFQEIRESKALAYASSSRYSVTSDKDYSNYNVSYIGTQADKLPEATQAMMQLLDSLPKSAMLYNTSKEALINTIRTERITKMAVLYSFDAYKKVGVDYDLRKDIFPSLQKLTFEDINAFQKKYIKGQKTKLLVIGSKDKIDLKALSKYGKVQELTLTDIFGY